MTRVDSSMMKHVRSADQHSQGSDQCTELMLKPLVEITQSTLEPLVKSAWETTDPQSGYRRVKAIVDSGASNSVASGSLAPEIQPVPSEGSRRGQTYASAAKGGKPLANEGEKVVSAITREGREITTQWQVVEVNRPLMSVHQICERGNVVVFGEHGGYIMNLMDRSLTHFGVEDNVYVLELLLPPPSNQPGFHRPGR